MKRLLFIQLCTILILSSCNESTENRNIPKSNWLKVELNKATLYSVKGDSCIKTTSKLYSDSETIKLKHTSRQTSYIKTFHKRGDTLLLLFSDTLNFYPIFGVINGEFLDILKFEEKDKIVSANTCMIKVDSPKIEKISFETILKIGQIDETANSAIFLAKMTAENPFALDFSAQKKGNCTYEKYTINDTSITNLIHLTNCKYLKNLRVNVVYNEYPNEFNKFKNISQLYFQKSNSNLNKLDISGIDNLNELIVADHALGIPYGYSKINNLKSIRLRGKDINKVPSEVYNCKNLEYLMVENSNIKKIEKKIQFLSSLRQLQLRGNPYLSSIPSGIYKLDSLWNLNLANCNIKTVNVETKTIKPLKVLDLSFNKNINPESLENLPDSIKTLDLSGCNLKTIPLSLKENFPNNLIVKYNPNISIPSWVTKEMLRKIVK